MKKALSLLLVCLMLLPMFAFAESTQTLPISAEPITVTAWVLDVNNDDHYTDSKIWDWIFEKTNVRFDVKTFSMSQQEALQLNFATLDELPDVGLRMDIPSELLIDAAEGGALVELTDELLEEYAPYWYNYLKTHSSSDARVNGNTMRLSLGNIDNVDYVINLRDQLLINKVWLDELNLAVPTTLDEFTAVLQAFKDNAGKGSIPAEVMPYYFTWEQKITSMLDVLGFFGITCFDKGWLAVDNGTVVYQAVNPEIIPAIKYLRELYQKGLIPAECFTDDRNMAVSRTGSEGTPYIGVFGSYNISNPIYVAMSPIDAGTGKGPYIRKQTATYTHSNGFTLYSKNPYIKECLQVIDWIASDPVATANVQLGMQGYYWDFDEDGKITPIPDAESKMTPEEKKLYAGFGNFIAGIRDEDFYAAYSQAEYQEFNSRPYNYRNFYEAYVPKGETVYRNASTGDTDMDTRRSDLATGINNLRATTLARWITDPDADIDAEWDAYVAEANNKGLEEYLELCQAGYDTLGLY